MRNFYQDIITEKSWKLLTKLKREVEFVLIGGWAVYLYTKALKSKDIDIIIDFSHLDRLRNSYSLYKNERLKKYEIKEMGLDIDIYLPHYSNLGIPVNLVMANTQSVETFSLPRPEILLTTKQKAYSERKSSIKGQKDKIDIFSLIFLENFDVNFYKNLLKDHNLLDYKKQLANMLRETTYVEELNLDRHFFSKKKKEFLARLIR